ncbi:MAG: hypothetical protein M5U12_37820 [Verrucomicrobia bacterium]|nr:hypothetical protein [Verrucomicrobiota bacterium]
MKTLNALSLSLGLWLTFLGPRAHAAVTITTDRTVGAGDTSLENQAVVVDRATLTLAGPHTFTSLELRNGATLTHPTGTTGLVLTVTGNVTIASDASISVDGRGYPFAGNSGPGAGARGDWSGSGAGYGGSRRGVPQVRRAAATTAPFSNPPSWAVRAEAAAVAKVRRVVVSSASR